ncbi:hypothetical protein ACTFIU_010950 [Dictyostelium citrinum]
MEDNNSRLNNIYNNITLKITFKEFSNYKFKNLLKSLIIDGTDGNEDDILIIKKGDLSNGLQSLSIECKNVVFEEACIPDTLESLELLGKFNEKLNKSMFTNINSLTSLVFGGEFNQSLEGNWLPTNLKKLNLCYKFNQIIKPNQLPESLTHLSFGDWFNQPLDGNWLPKNLIKLVFGRSFDQPFKVSHQLPQSLTSIILNDGYEGVIEANSIPESVITLDYKIDTSRKYSSIDEAPNFVTRLYITGPSAGHLDFKTISKNVTYLKIGSNIDIKPSILPNSIETLIYDSHLSNFKIKENVLPKSLKTFEINGTGCCISDDDEDKDKNLQFNQLFPPSLVKLKVNGPFTNIGFKGLETFNNLISLDLRNVSLSTILLILPKNLTTLSIGYSKVDESLKVIDFPSSLTNLHLHINETKNCEDNNNNINKSDNFKVLLPVLESIPKSISSLKLLGDFNQPLSSVCGKLTNVSFLELGKRFNETIDISELPPNLKSLTITNPEFNRDVIKSSNETAPSCLQSINIYYNLYVYPINGLSFDQFTKYINYIKNKNY